MTDDPRLASLAAGLSPKWSGPAPVDLWDPPYCGDIGLAIDAHGIWYYGGSPIRRPALIQMFARILKCEADGRHYLVTPVEKVDIAVADAPFRAVALEVLGEGSGQTLSVTTDVGDVVACGADRPLRFQLAGDGGLKPYVRVRGRLEALLTRGLTHELLALAVPVPSVAGGPTYAVWSGGICFRLP